MRILIIGAGVTGSIFASALVNSRSLLEKKLREKVEIKLLARGETFRRIGDNGLKINHIVQKVITFDSIPVISKLESGDRYDYVLVFLRKTQIKNLLPDLISNKSEYFLFFGNNGTGTEHLKGFHSAEKIALGFAMTGGRREGDTVYSVHGKKPALIFGPAGQDRKKRMGKLKKIMTLSGIKATVTRRMDSWLKYHIALVSPVARAVYLDGGDNRSLADNTELLKTAVKAMKEGIRALKSLKFPVKPLKLRLLVLLPDPFIRHKIKKLLSSDMGRLLVYDHCMAAPEEMDEIAEEFRKIVEKTDLPLVNLHNLD